LNIFFPRKRRTKCIASRLLKEALVTHTHSLEIRRQVFGEVHEAVASTLNAMGAVYRDQGLASAAIDCFSQALQMYRQVHANDGGDNHPDCAMTMAAIRCVLQSLQEESAEEKEVIEPEPAQNEATRWLPPAAVPVDTNVISIEPAEGSDSCDDIDSARP